jgi:pimeloyl-ACP methyl ester carboxylesterase
MDSGLGGSSLDWVLVQSRLAATTRVCTYDRGGMGWSDAGPAPRSPGRLAEELHRLLAAARIQPPFVLVGHSLAGKNVRLFAAAHPDEVAGMVLVDARSELMDTLATSSESEGLSAGFKAQAAAFTAARRLGLVRLLGAGFVGEPLVPSAVAAEMALLATQPSAVDETLAEGLARSDDDATLADARLGSMPLLVIAASANVNDLPHWGDAQHALAALSGNGRLVVADSGHYVQLEQPDVVVNGILEVLGAARRSP